jgi:hypothetical protein
MFHGPNCETLKCWSERNGCQYGFPKEYCETTSFCEGEYPLYRRRPPFTRDGNIIGTGTTPRGQSITNRNIVSYSPWLLLLFRCHINVEVVASLNTVKYVFKYIWKGPDYALTNWKETAIEEGGVEMPDEIEHYSVHRYLTSSEAFWHIFKFPTSHLSATVHVLPVHLEEEQQIMFDEEELHEQYSENPMVLEEMYSETKLTAFFKLNAVNPEARNFSYADIPTYFTWDQKEKAWKKRRRMNNQQVSRLQDAYIREGERFYLRILLLNVKGPTSYDSLKQNPHNAFLTYPTFREAANVRGLTDADETWIQTLQEVNAFSSNPKELISTFATLLENANVSAPLVLWNRFKNDMTHILRRSTYRNTYTFFCRNERQDFADAAIENVVLQQLQAILSHDLSHYGGLPDPKYGDDFDEFFLHATAPVQRHLGDNERHQNINPRNLRHLHTTGINTAEEEASFNTLFPNLSEDQRIIFNTIMDAVENPSEIRQFVLDGPAGTFTKTY